MSKIPVEYSSNNSGGSWWLKPKDWVALKKAGWKLFGHGDYAYKDGYNIPDKNGLPSYKSEIPKTEQDVEEYPFLRSDKTPYDAYKLFDNIQEAIIEFEKLTDQNVTDEGCNCCGPPHSFTWGKDIIVRVDVNKQDYNTASGEDLLSYMYPTAPTELSKRELIEQLKPTRKDT